MQIRVSAFPTTMRKRTARITLFDPFLYACICCTFGFYLFAFAVYSVVLYKFVKLGTFALPQFIFASHCKEQNAEQYRMRRDHWQWN